MNALIADDSPFLRKELRDMVNRMDIDRVFEATDGNEALDVCASEQPDLILLDIVMEGMDGITFLKEMQKQGAGEDHTVFVISAVDEEAVKETAQDLGVARFIEKPVTMAEIEDAVRHVRNQ